MPETRQSHIDQLSRALDQATRERDERARQVERLRAALEEARALIETAEQDGYVSSGWREDARRWQGCWTDA